MTADGNGRHPGRRGRNWLALGLLAVLGGWPLAWAGQVGAWDAADAQGDRLPNRAGTAAPAVLQRVTVGDAQGRRVLSLPEPDSGILVSPPPGDGWAAPIPLTGFAFAAVGDIHLVDTKSVEIANAAVDRINADPAIAFSLWLGDLTQASQPDEMTLARLALARLRRPFYTVPGNHDLRPGVYAREFGEAQRSFVFAGWTFLLLDTTPGDKTPVAADRLDWLRQAIAAAPVEAPLVLAGHHPLMPHTKAYPLAGAADIVGLFANRRLRACLAGHYHGNQEEIVDGVLFATTACCSSTRTNFDGTTAKGYRRFACSAGGTITSEFVTVDPGTPTPAGP